ncbi:MAG: hypothetical protein K6F84_02610 [Lachnospiraceae bacterium]|nr:hypothetical protein [Lachnospiraceae bacterium]
MKIKITNEVANNLVSNVNPFANKTNKIRVNIGIKELEDGLASKLTIVDTGRMVDVGFKATISGKVSDEEPKTASFNLKASQFVQTISALKEYNSDIVWDISEKIVNFKVGKEAVIPLSVVSDEDCEPLLKTDFDCTLCKMKFGKDFFITLNRGGYIATPGADPKGITDRVAIVLKDEKAYIYSCDGTAASKAWCPIKLEKNTTFSALTYLRDKGNALSDADKKTLMEKIQLVSNDTEALIALAKEEGYDPTKSISFALAGASTGIIGKLFSEADVVSAILTPQNLLLQANNILATFALAGECPAIYESIIDKWDQLPYSSKVVVDRDDFLRSINLLKLDDSEGGINFFFKTGSLSGKKGGTVVNTKVSANEGDVDKINTCLSGDKLSSAITKLSGGNCLIRICVENPSTPVSISSGDLSENISNIIYILTISNRNEEEDQATE